MALIRKISKVSATSDTYMETSLVNVATDGYLANFKYGSDFPDTRHRTGATRVLMSDYG